MPSITGGNNMDPEYFNHESEGVVHRFVASETERSETKPVDTRPSLELQVGNAYTDGKVTSIIMVKLQRDQAPILNDAAYEYVSHLGALYAKNGKAYLSTENDLIMPWKMAEGVYCESDIRGYELLRKHGGDWLGCAREWIQRAAINGEVVTWGSQQHLQLRGVTVLDIENLAANSAAAAISEYAKGHYLLRAVNKAKENGE